MDKKKNRNAALRGLVLMFRREELKKKKKPAGKKKKRKTTKPSLDDIVSSVANKEKE